MGAGRSPDEPLLAVDGLVVEARTAGGVTRIVDTVGFRVRPGEVLGLIGESGAGKSTVGLAAMGFARDGCRIAAGSIRFDGMELATAPEAACRALRGSRIAYVAQSAASTHWSIRRWAGLKPAAADWAT